MASVENVIHQTVDVGTSSTAVFGENDAGSLLILQNVSDTDMYLSFSGDAELNAGIYLKAGANMVLDVVVPDSPLEAIHGGTATKTLLVTRG